MHRQGDGRRELPQLAAPAGVPVGVKDARTKPIAKLARTLQNEQAAKTRYTGGQIREDRQGIEVPTRLGTSKRNTERIIDEYKAQGIKRNEEA